MCICFGDSPEKDMCMCSGISTRRKASACALVIPPKGRQVHVVWYFHQRETCACALVLPPDGDKRLCFGDSTRERDMCMCFGDSTRRKASAWN